MNPEDTRSVGRLPEALASLGARPGTSPGDPLFSKRHRGAVVLFSALCILLGGVPAAEAFLIGRLDVAPRLELEWMYDDNVWLREGADPRLPRVGDWVGRVWPGLDLTYDFGPTDLSVGYRTGFDFYTGKKSLFDQVFNRATRQDSYARNHDLTLSVGREFGTRTTVTITDTLGIGTDVADLVGDALGEGGTGLAATGILPDPSDYRINRTAVSVSHSLTRRLSLVVGGGYGYSWYDEVERDGRVQEPVREEHLGDLSAGLSFAWNPRNTLSVTVLGSYMGFGPRGETKSVAVTLGNAWQVTQALSFSVSLGGEYLDQLVEEAVSASVRSTYVRPVGDATLSLVQGAFTFSLAGNAGVSDSSGVGTAVFSRMGRFSVSWAPLTALDLRGFGMYSRDESVFSGEGVEMESYQAGGGVTYRLRTWVAASFRYAYVNQKALGTSGTSYEDNRFVLGVVLSLPDSFG